MQVPAPDFGGLLTRTKCDACGGPVYINWKSRDGKDCCSKACQARCEAGGSAAEVASPPKVTGQPKVTARSVAPIAAKVTSPAKVTRPSVEAPPSHREQQQTKRRAEIRRFMSETVRRTHSQPTVRVVEGHLKQHGLGASHRTVWKDLIACGWKAPS
jgi:hypothetical protein